MAIESLSVVGLVVLDIAEGATTPAPTKSGWAWSSTLSKPVYWDSTRWRSVTNVAVSTTAPSNPATGDLWLDIS